MEGLEEGTGKREWFYLASSLWAKGPIPVVFYPLCSSKDLIVCKDGGNKNYHHFLKYTQMTMISHDR